MPRGVTAPAPVIRAWPLPFEASSVTPPGAPHVVHGLLDRGDLLRLLVGNLHPELLLELHDQLHEVQRVGLKVLAEGGVGRHVALVHPQPVGGYLLIFSRISSRSKTLLPTRIISKQRLTGAPAREIARSVSANPLTA